MTGFSIIICTHNPNVELFDRLLNAILHFSEASPRHEVILVDNNSGQPLAELLVVKEFMAAKSDVYILQESTPGLTAARICGINAARYDWIVFFDDDNEPEANYLQLALQGIEDYPQVGCWGPGSINVEYLSEVEEWLHHKKKLFQQRHEMVTRFDNQRHWQDCYPFGTGMIVKRDIASEYTNRVKARRYTLTDRKGKSLSSGGDVQMVLTGIDLGHHAGVLKDLSLKHMIDQGKANLKYLRRQQYGTASAYVKAYNQVFFNAPICVQEINNSDIIKRIYSLKKIYRKSLPTHDFSLLLASKLGEMNAVVYANDQKAPLALKIYERLIHA